MPDALATITGAPPFPDDETFISSMGDGKRQFTSKFWSEEDRARYGSEVKPTLMKLMTEKYPNGQAFELRMVAIIASAHKL